MIHVRLPESETTVDASKPFILTLTSMHESGMKLLLEASDLKHASALDAETLRREIVNADALLIRTQGEVDAALLDCAPKLRVVGRHGVGVDQIDLEAATERGVLVLNTPGANSQAVCEHTIAFMIAVSKHFTRMNDAVLAGDYFRRTKFMGRELFGRSLGIVGFGRVGRRVGKAAHQGFGMNVVYNDIVAPPREDEIAAGARRVEFDELLQTCEYVSLHVPLDASTRRMINRSSLSKMRSDAILINTCRGPVVDEVAVAEALDAGKLWGYAADVFEVEPPPDDHPLIGRPDVFLTPHSAAQTVESLTNMATWIAEDMIGVLYGAAPRNPVNDPRRVAAARERLGLPPLTSSPWRR